VRLASESDRIHAAGGEVIAVSIDDAVRQAGMFARWPTPNVLYVDDPDRSRIIEPLGLTDPNDDRRIALPAMLVIDPDGNEVYRYVGRDFADRTTDDQVYAALEALDLGPIDPPAGGPIGPVPDDLGRFFTPRNLRPYFLGNRSASIAIGGRTDDRELRAISREHRLMCDATLAAWETLTDG
jgi:hypothetical protein